MGAPTCHAALRRAVWTALAARWAILPALKDRACRPFRVKKVHHETFWSPPRRPPAAPAYAAALAAAVPSVTRSKRRTPIVGVAGTGAGPYKQVRAGQERARLRTLLASGREAEVDRELAPWDEWACGRDGKQWVGDTKPREMRK